MRRSWTLGRKRRLVEAASSSSGSNDDGLLLVADPSSVGAARRFVRTGCDLLCSPSLVADAELLVSELVSNAVGHAQGPIEVTLDLQPHAVTVRVRDRDRGTPTLRSVGPDSEGGRGLLLVDVLSDSSGCDWEDAGKTVWFTLRVQAEGGAP